MEIGAGVPFTYTPAEAHHKFTFEQFVEACNNVIAEHDIDTACNFIVQMLPDILLNHTVINEIIPSVRGRWTLYEKSPGELTILGHYHPETVQSHPHDHGRTWAIYGVTSGRTAMHEWKVVEPAQNDQRARVNLTKSYWITPGVAYYYPTGAIHSHQTFEDSRLIRIEGMNIKRRELKIGGKYFDPIL